MICKPIKTGCTIYCINFSKSAYLYTWEWYTGSKHDAPQGQPTDTAPIEEDNEQHTGYVLPLCLRLIRPAFDGTYSTVYTDKAFTTIKLAKALARRGIGLIGMVRGAARPKKWPRGAGEYWAFRGYAKSEGDGLQRGWARRAYQTLGNAHGRAWQLMAETWLDSTFVTMLSTAWSSRVPCKVLAAHRLHCRPHRTLTACHLAASTAPLANPQPARAGAGEAVDVGTARPRRALV